MRISSCPGVADSDSCQIRLDQRAQELYLNRGFAFQASAWFEAAPVFVELSRVWRQKDAKLVSVLNRVRKGVMSSNDCAFLNYHCATVSRPNTVAVPAASAGGSGHE